MAETETESLRRHEAASAEEESPGDFRQRLIVPVLIALHLALTLFLAYKLNIWVDEAFSLRTTERGVGYALHQALNFELQAPLYFILLSLWRKINGSIFFARLFSVACVALSIKVIASLAGRYLKNLHPAWIVAALAFNPLVIAVAVDVRLYALVLLLSALLLLTFYDGFLTETRSRRAQVCYVLLAVAALYTQYYMGFLLAANACALVCLKRWRALFEYLVGMMIVGLCFLPMLPFIRYQLSAHTAPIHSRESWFEGFKFVTWRMKDYFLPPNVDISLWVRSLLLKIFYVAAIFLIYKKRRSLAPETLALWTITIVVAFFFLLTARLSGEMLLQIRHTTVLFLPVNFAVFALVLLADKKRAVLIWTLLVLLFSLPALYLHYRPMAKSGDWQRVAAYLMSEEKPEQAILIFHAGAALPLENYYAGRNRLVPVPRENTFERFDFHDYVLRDEREISNALERTPGTHDEVWLVTDGDCGFADLSYHCEILEGFVGKYYMVAETRYFDGSMVRLLKRKN
jgi:hypothetical protein